MQRPVRAQFWVAGELTLNCEVVAAGGRRALRYWRVVPCERDAVTLCVASVSVTRTSYSAVSTMVASTAMVAWCSTES